MDKTYFPIVVFAFNRPKEFKRLIDSLKQNPEAKFSELFIFIDGPRSNVMGEQEMVKSVINYSNSITGFRKINIKNTERNRGLAPSIIYGVTEILREHNAAIILEDDLILSSSFLRYMNTMLKNYETDDRIFQISGFCPKLKNHPSYVNDIFLNSRAQCWSWGTWRNRWDSVDWNVIDFELLKTNKILRKEFNKNGSDMFGMLKSFMDGKISSWYIRFCYSMHKYHKYAICPIKSLVKNEGFNNSATHCNNFNRYKTDFEPIHFGDFKIVEELHPNAELMRDALKYWSIQYRIYGKIRTFFQIQMSRFIKFSIS